MTLLGGLSPQRFLAEHWQKKPLLVRQAVPGFAGLLSRDDLLALATRPDATSRLVLHHPRRRSKWERHDGPFGALDASMLPAREWTLLVHGIESLVRGGWELLRKFDFLPASRIDDLMVSYAAEGGGVGPHDDRYDVFLLQASGRRRWRIARSYDATPDPDAAIRVLHDFEPEEEWVLEPGDMLYLPPDVAHLGVAETPCFTYSIGFLAPSEAQLVQSFLGYLGNVLPLDEDRLFVDPSRKPTREPHALDRDMLGFLERSTEMIRWEPRLLEDFLGCYLTRPRAHTRFPVPRRPLSLDAFAQRLRKKGRLELTLPTRCVYQGGRLFVNGEAVALSRRTLATMQELVRERWLALPAIADDALHALVHGYYLAGWVAFV